MTRLVRPALARPLPTDALACCSKLGEANFEQMEKGGDLLGGSNAAEFFFFWLFSLVLVAAAAFLTAHVCPGVSGSGIPVRYLSTDLDHSFLLFLWRWAIGLIVAQQLHIAMNAPQKCAVTIA